MAGHSMSRLLLTALVLLISALQARAAGLRARRSQTILDDGSNKFVIASFPDSRVVLYSRPEWANWRQLVVQGLTEPKALAVDQQQLRLYVADNAAAKIFWYQLHVAENILMTDGQSHLAVQGVVVRSLALAQTGANAGLYFSGHTVPLNPALGESIDGVFFVNFTAVQNCGVTVCQDPPEAVWKQSDTGTTVEAISMDSFAIWWGNQQKGKSKGAVVKASKTCPIADPSSAMKTYADNVDEVYSVVQTPTTVFYGAAGSIYAVQKNKAETTCGQQDHQCPTVSHNVSKPMSMAWDGDGTIFIADKGKGKVFTMPSGAAQGSVLSAWIDAAGIWGMDVLVCNPDE